MKILFLALLLFTGACKETGSMSSSKDALPELSVELNPESMKGCRSPAEDGCNSCKVVINGKCYYQQGFGPFGNVAPWYNGGGADVDCKMQIPSCAKCSNRDEAQLRELSKKPTCDCTNVKVGNDPCFAPGTCECFCHVYRGAFERCSAKADANIPPPVPSPPPG